MPAIVGTPQLSDLLIQETSDDIFNAELTIAQEINLPTTSWQAGDPTRSLLFIESELIAALEANAVGFISSGFLDYAQDEWLLIQAQQQFGVNIPPATFATTDVTLTNSGGGIYVIAPLELTFKNSSTGATYHNTTGGTLTGVGTPGATLDLTVEADQAGSASNASAGEISTLVTSLLGVTCTNAAAAVGVDVAPKATIVQQCRNAAGALSPNGPAAAYAFVALNSALTGIETPTRARVLGDSEFGDVTIYVAGASGGLSSPDVAAVQSAIQIWSTPLCITPTVVSATTVIVNVTYQVWLYQGVGQTPAQIQTAILTALETFFSERPIGGDIIPPASTGFLYVDMIKSVVGGTFTDSTFRVAVSVPSGDLALTAGQVPILGAVSGTVTIIPDPT